MAEIVFNRELGAAPAGITRFGQTRTEDAGNVTIESVRRFAADGLFPLADVCEIEYGATGTASISLNAGSFGIRGLRVYDASGELKAEIPSPKRTRRVAASATYSVTNGDTATIYIDRSERGSADYRVTVTAA